MNLRGLYPKQGQIMMGQDIAYRMGKGIGDEIVVLGPLIKILACYFHRKNSKSVEFSQQKFSTTMTHMHLSPLLMEKNI